MIEELTDLTSLQAQKIKEYVLLRDDSYGKLAALLREISVNKDVPPVIFELAKTFVIADGIETSFAQDLIKLNSEIIEVSQRLYPQ
jgi:hypothetical protein